MKVLTQQHVFEGHEIVGKSYMQTEEFVYVGQLREILQDYFSFLDSLGNATFTKEAVKEEMKERFAVLFKEVKS